MGPFDILRRGPRGPSGVKAKCWWLAIRIIWRIAASPPRFVDSAGGALGSVHRRGTGLGLASKANAAREIHTTLTALGEELGMPGEVSLEALLRWKDSFMAEEVSYHEEDLLTAFDKAVEGLMDMRRKEGDTLAKEILRRVPRTTECR